CPAPPRAAGPRGVHHRRHGERRNHAPAARNRRTLHRETIPRGGVDLRRPHHPGEGRMSQEYSLELLVVDDQEPIRKLCMTIGEAAGFRCSEAESAEAALAYVESHAPELVLVDLRMDEMSGLEFLATAKKKLPRSEVALMTGYGSIESAVNA